MLDLKYALDLVFNRLDDGALAQWNFVHQLDQLLLHGCLVASDQLQALLVELFEESLRDRASVSKEFSEQALGHLGNRLAVIDIAGSEFEGQQFPSLVDYQMQLNPSNGVFAPPDSSFEDSMRLGATGMTDFNRSGIDKANTSDFPSGGCAKSSTAPSCSRASTPQIGCN